MYVATLGNHPALRLVAIHDRDADRRELHAARWNVPAFDSLDGLLESGGAEIVLNLTNPRSHDAVTRRCLEADRHVYSEKPLAMRPDRARELVELAAEKSLMLAAAPCSMLSEAADTLAAAVRRGLIGPVRLAYGNFEDGMIAPHQAPWTWKNAAGIPWPARDEFEVGCTFEHAGYVLSWLVKCFGPARKITSFASCQIPDKGIEVDAMAPDFTVGCLTFDDGVVARVTCGLVAPRDKSLAIIGDDGVLWVDSVRSDRGPVWHRPARATGWSHRVRSKANGALGRLGPLGRRLPGFRTAAAAVELPLIRRPPALLVSEGKPVDFLRGVAEMAQALRCGTPCEMTGTLALHLNEITYRLQNPPTPRFQLETTFDRLAGGYAPDGESTGADAGSAESRETAPAP